MPWLPEFFTAPAAERIRAEARAARRTAVPYFDGVMSGDTGALVRSFAGEPELHHPTLGRVRGERAFARFVGDTNAWLAQRNAAVTLRNLIEAPGRIVEEVVLALDAGGGRVELPVAIASDRDADERVHEVRVYFSTWPLNGTHAIRPPLLQRDPDVNGTDAVADYQRALSAGDVDAAVATFEPDGYVREPAGAPYLHRGTDELRRLYTAFFSNGGGIPLEHCSVTDDGTACAMEYNVVRWGRTEMPPQAGIAVYARGDSGRLARAHIYDDCHPPVAPV